MWHLKTKLGTFWIVPTEDSKQFWLGIEEERLGLYKTVDEAANDVYQQSTGYTLWDSQNRIKAPIGLNEWEIGEPVEWQS